MKTNTAVMLGYLVFSVLSMRGDMIILKHNLKIRVQDRIEWWDVANDNEPWDSTKAAEFNKTSD
jgi:hypothetical protein